MDYSDISPHRNFAQYHISFPRQKKRRYRWEIYEISALKSTIFLQEAFVINVKAFMILKYYESR